MLMAKTKEQQANPLKYVFHKESSNKLKEFLKGIQNADETSSNGTEDFTNSVSNTISVPEETAINQNKNEISVIYSENDDYQPVQDTEELEFSEIEGNALLANDLVDIIIESLSMENTIAVDEIKKLVSEPFSIYVEDIFVKLSKMLDLEDVCNLGHILCSFENYDISRIISLYYKHLLFPKLHIDQTATLQKTFSIIYSKFPHLMRRNDIVACLLEVNCSNSFLQNIRKLDVERKDEILRDIVINCKKLEARHFRVIEQLMEAKSESHVISRIIDVMASQTSESCNDKSFGKLLIAVIQVLGTRVHQFELPLRQMIRNHRSPWKNKAEKMFNDYCESSHLSQSLIKF